MKAVISKPLFSALNILLLIIIINYFSFPQQLSLRQITFSDSTHDGYPYWSPDGKFIIYSSGTRTSCTTMKVPSDGGSPVELTKYFSQHAQYSPDGSYIAFDGKFGTRIFIASSDGSSPIRIVPENIPIERSGMPCWSPDGKMITFHSKGELMTLELMTGKFKKIFLLEDRKILPYCWSANGKYIYASALDTANRKYDLWKIHSESGVAKQLTYLNSVQTKPSLSPDNSMLVFTSDHGGNMDLWIMNSNGGMPVQITFFSGDDKNPGFDVEASWSPDGKKIAFTSTRTGYWAIWIMELDLNYIKDKLRSD